MKILIAGIGNLFKGDDGFGCEVAKRLLEVPLGGNVDVRDFGIRGYDLAYALAGGDYEVAILVDAVQRGKSPGTISLIEPDLEALNASGSGLLGAEPHGMHPARVLALAQVLSGKLPEVRLVGCEPENIAAPDGPVGPEGDDDLRIGLSPRVQAAVEEAVGLIVRVVGEVRSEAEVGTCTK